jgi:hypothetical protein
MDVYIQERGEDGGDILLDVARVKVKRTLIHIEYMDVCKENDVYRKENVCCFEIESSQVETTF